MVNMLMENNVVIYTYVPVETRKKCRMAVRVSK